MLPSLQELGLDRPSSHERLELADLLMQSVDSDDLNACNQCPCAAVESYLSFDMRFDRSWPGVRRIFAIQPTL
jgi:hypothetical protein